MLMFHGTSTDAAKRIMQQGFTLKLVGQRQRAVHGDDTLDPKGVFVTSDPMKAKWYAGPDPKRPGLNRGGAVIEVKVNGRIMPTKKWWELKRQINDEMGLGMWDPRRGEAVLRAQEEAQKQGYAGFHEDGDEYVIFNPRDLKPVRAYLADNEEPLPRTARPSRVAARYITAASLSVEEYYGKAGRKDHLTRYEKGTIPTKDALKIEPPRRYHGKREWHTKGGERYFGNYTEEEWGEFMEDIRKNGIKTPLWIQKDPGEDAALMEGNHRVQAADQLGIREVPVYIRYYGLSEEDGLAAPSVRRTIKHQDPERVKTAAQRVAARYAATTPLPPAFPKGEPGLMTSKEFIEFRNPGGKSHPDDAYDFDLEKMNKDHSFQTHEYKFDGYSIEENNKGTKITRDGKLVAVVHNGTMYLENTSHKGKIITEWRDRRGEEHDLGVKTYKKVKYLSEKMPLISPVARNNFGDYPVLLQNLIVKGEPMTMRAEKQPGLNEKVNLAILNAEGLEVAVAQNEWGASLFVVAQEYRGRGLGKIIGKKWYELNPASTSGGFSNSGYANALALWEDRVKEFMGRGWYSELIREGTLTHQQVKAILAGIGERPPRPEPEPEEVQPTGDILTYVDPGNSDFIVYDRAFFDDPDERFIHGYGFLRSQPRIGPYFFALDYDQPYADLVNRTGLQMARDGGDDRLYDGEGYSDTLELNGLPGIERDGDHITLTQDLLPGLSGLASKERRIRKERDSYDEKLVLLQEQANSKWR